jgi:hypothetical protein
MRLYITLLLIFFLKISAIASSYSTLDTGGLVSNKQIDVEEEDEETVEFESNLSFDNSISTNNKTGLIFQIFIKSSKVLLDEAFVEHLEPVFIERTVDLNKYTYYVGQFRTLEAARLAKRELINLGYNKSKIISYLDGVKIPLFKAKKLIDQEILISKKYYASLREYELKFFNKIVDNNSLSYTDIEYNVDGKYNPAKQSFDSNSYSLEQNDNFRHDFGKWALSKMKWYKKNPYWKFGGELKLDFTQQSLTDWTKGGDNFISLITDNKFNANYKKGIIKWYSYVKERLVYMKVEDEDMRKSDEKFEFNSILGVEAIGNWFYEVKFNLKSQLFPAHDRNNPDLKLNDLLSPGNATFALGMEYDPSVNFSILISPITFKSTFVLMDKEIDPKRFGIDEGESLDVNFGSFSEINFMYNFTPKFNVKGKVLLFSDYVENINNVDFDGELIVSYKIAPYFSLRLSNYAIYKENQNVNVIKGKKVAEGFRDGFQIKEYFTVGLTYDF